MIRGNDRITTTIHWYWFKLMGRWWSAVSDETKPGPVGVPWYICGNNFLHVITKLCGNTSNKNTVTKDFPCRIGVGIHGEKDCNQRNLWKGHWVLARPRRWILERTALRFLVVKDWNVNVSGEGKITPFEQYSICCMCMVARRDFRQETVAGMYMMFIKWPSPGTCLYMDASAWNSRERFGWAGHRDES